MPILEAFFLGTPVITSNRSSMAEIASGGSALLVDPTKEEELARAMASLCDDNGLRQGLIERGYERLKDFSYEAMASGTIAIYNSIINRGKKCYNSN